MEQLPPVDVAYLDPPYNQHPYGSNYFMLNLLASGREPAAEELSQVSGIPKNWNRSHYNKSRHFIAFNRFFTSQQKLHLLHNCHSDTLLAIKISISVDYATDYSVRRISNT